MIESRYAADAAHAYRDLDFQGISVKKRDERLVDFDPIRIHRAIEEAFRAEFCLYAAERVAGDLVSQIIDITRDVLTDVLHRAQHGVQLEIELIQDSVEDQLMKAGQFAVARRYILYREERTKARALHGGGPGGSASGKKFLVVLPDGSREPLDPQRIRRRLIEAVAGYEDRCDWRDLAEEVMQSLFNGVTPPDIEKALIVAVQSRIEKEPACAYVAARLLLKQVYRDAWNESIPAYDFEPVYRKRFNDFIRFGVEKERLDPVLADFDLDRLAATLKPERDHRLDCFGLQMLFDRYFLRVENRAIETPQYFWMRVAMGLAVNEGDQKTDRAVAFYDTLSTLRFVPSSPMLFNAGTPHPQLSACYLLTVMDDLDHIFKTVSDNAMLSKWAGGLGNDWTSVRASGSYIKGTDAMSQGVVPFLKVANDTAEAVNQGGKRQGSLCSYLETWHLDIEAFIELHHVPVDEPRHAQGTHTANWIPDLFMKRVRENGPWTLFSPSDAPDLHNVFGREFEERYKEYEKLADTGRLEHFRRVDALELWRKMLNMLSETGHPWITFKDPANIRSPQDHAGVIHSSNLATEILLNTSPEEPAACNLGSINLVEHIGENGLDEARLAQTVSLALRMLDNAVDINFYPIPEAGESSLTHRPVGLGLMGFQDTLHKLDLAYASDAAVAFADRSMEALSFYTILASAELAKERGTYPSYGGSKWERGQLPIDTLDLLERERGGHLVVDRGATLDWARVREAVEANGMRNSNVMALAPTTSIAVIADVSPAIEPTVEHLREVSHDGGLVTRTNPYLVEALKARNLWDDEMIEDLKFHRGRLHRIRRVPADLKQKFATGYDIDPEWLIECASRRQKWIDMGQSLNVYLAEPSVRALSEMYTLAWHKGLKTTFHLRVPVAARSEQPSMSVARRNLPAPAVPDRIGLRGSYQESGRMPSQPGDIS